MKLSDYIADFLSKLTGHAITGHGGCIVHLLDSLESHPKIKIVPCQNEQGAPLSAEAYARVSRGASYVTEEFIICLEHVAKNLTTS